MKLRLIANAADYTGLLSAYLIAVILLSEDVIQLVYVENKSGERQQPWGVPVLVVMGFDRLLSTRLDFRL